MRIIAKSFICLSILNGLYWLGIGRVAAAMDLRVIEGDASPAGGCGKVLHRDPYVLTGFNVDARATELAKDELVVTLLNDTGMGQSLCRRFQSGRARELLNKISRADERIARIVLTRLSLAANDLIAKQKKKIDNFRSLQSTQHDFVEKLRLNPRRFLELLFAFAAKNLGSAPLSGDIDMIRYALKAPISTAQIVAAESPPAITLPLVLRTREQFIDLYLGIYENSLKPSLNDDVVLKFAPISLVEVNRVANLYLDVEEILVDIAETVPGHLTPRFRTGPVPRLPDFDWRAMPDLSEVAERFRGDEEATWHLSTLPSEFEDAVGSVSRRSGLAVDPAIVNDTYWVHVEFRADRLRFRFACWPSADCVRLRAKLEPILRQVKFATSAVNFTPVFLETDGALWVLGFPVTSPLSKEFYRRISGVSQSPDPGASSISSALKPANDNQQTSAD